MAWPMTGTFMVYHKPVKEKNGLYKSKFGNTRRTHIRQKHTKTQSGSLWYGLCSWAHVSLICCLSFMIDRIWEHDGTWMYFLPFWAKLERILLGETPCLCSKALWWIGSVSWPLLNFCFFCIAGLWWMGDVDSIWASNFAPMKTRTGRQICELRGSNRGFSHQEDPSS